MDRNTIHNLQKLALRQIKKYKPNYIVADKAYDTEPIRKCINEELKAFDHNTSSKTEQKKDNTD